MDTKEIDLDGSNDRSGHAEPRHRASTVLGLDMVKFGYLRNMDELKNKPWDKEIKYRFKQAGIRLTQRFFPKGDYIYFGFNANSFLGTSTSFAKSTDHYKRVFERVEGIVQHLLCDSFTLDKCIVSNLELHKTFPVEQKPYDYYRVIKELDLQLTRKIPYRENGENSGSVYWLNNIETFIIYDKTDRMAYKHKGTRKHFENMDERLIRAEWRLKTHELIQERLGVITPADLLNYYTDIERQYVSRWLQILIELKEQPCKRGGESVSGIEAEFKMQQQRHKLKYCQDAIENRYIHMLCRSGEIDNFLKAKKGSPECNKRLNDKARRIMLNTSRAESPHAGLLYNELRDKILGD